VASLQESVLTAWLCRNLLLVGLCPGEEDPAVADEMVAYLAQVLLNEGSVRP
jgi:hypothetical protein